MLAPLTPPAWRPPPPASPFLTPPRSHSGPNVRSATVSPFPTRPLPGGDDVCSCCTLAVLFLAQPVLARPQRWCPILRRRVRPPPRSPPPPPPPPPTPTPP